MSAVSNGQTSDFLFREKLPAHQVFYTGAAAHSLFLANPKEYAFFVSADADDICFNFIKHITTNARWSEQLIEDWYFETAQNYFRQACSSLRVRTYPNRHPLGQFDVVWLEWEPEQSQDQVTSSAIRCHRAVVQSCGGDEGALTILLNQYHSLGYRRVLTLRKVRRSLVLVPPSILELDLHDPDIPNPPKASECLDCGLSIMVDQCIHPYRSTIVEVEFDERHEGAALEMKQHVLECCGDRWQHKQHNKIVYTLDGLPIPTISEQVEGEHPETSTGQLALVPAASSSTTRYGWAANDASADHEWPATLGLTLRSSWLRSASPTMPGIRIRTPGRLHFAVWSNKKTRYGAGGGGLGISASCVETEIEIAAESRGQTEHMPAANHFLALFSSLVGYDPNGLQLRTIASHPFVHSGFGSNICFNVAVMWGLNAMFGMPFTVDEIAEIVAVNYVENGRNGRVRSGHDTGVGAACLFHGGFVWLDESGQYMGNLDSGELHAVTAIGPGRARSPLGTGADQNAANHLDQLQSEIEYFDFAREFTLQTLWPLFCSGDRTQFLHRARVLRDRWTEMVSPAFCDRDILRKWTNTVEKRGAIYSGLSSEGPLLYALVATRDEAAELVNAVKNDFATDCADFRVAAVGSRIFTRPL